MSSKCVPSVASDPPFIQIPFGWKRELIDRRIVYYSPTNSCLQSFDELSEYLESEGTCKCGLECPLHILKTFNFEPSVASKPYDIEVAKSNNQNELCNHKRKIIALATYREHSLETQQLIAEQKNQTRLVHKQRSEPENDSQTGDSVSDDFQNFQSDDNRCAQTNECLNTCNVANHISEKTESPVRKSANESVSVIQPNDNFNKSDQQLTQTVLSHLSYNCPNLLPQNINRLQNATQRQTIIGGQQYIQQTPNCDNRCQYSVPIASDALRETGNSFCLYDQNGNSGVYSFSACDSTHISVQSNDNKTSIYLTPHNTSNYGQMISYENPNVNLIQTSHPQAFTSEAYNHYSPAFHSSDNVCNSNITTIPSYIPLPSANANSGAISFSANPLSTNAITLNPTYHSSLQTSQNSSRCSQNNISILPANPPMPPLSVPNVSAVTTSVNDVIPAVGIAPQIINTTNTSGAPQVLQFINSVPLTQITANTVTVLQQSGAQDMSVPGATLIIPQLMSSHEHPVVINHAMTPQTAVFPHIATAAGLTALSNPFQNTISIANAISLPQRTCVSETGKPSRSRRRKEYNRTNRSHPPTVASILKQAAIKEQEMNNKQKLQQKDQELQTNSENNESNSVTNSTIIQIDSSDSIQKESISVAVQSEPGVDSENPVEGYHEVSSFQSDNEYNDSPEQSVPNLQRISVQSDNTEENPISDSSSEHSSPSNESCNGTGSDSGVESEPMAPSPPNNCMAPDTQQVADSSRLKSLKRLKRLRKELSVYYGNDNSDDESPQSPPLPPQTRTFNIGDLVWGQMGDVRFWPGKLVTDEELVGLPIQREEGKLIVKWFGDHSLTQVEPQNLKTLSEGLEEHHCARKRHRSGKRMNTCLEQAIQEAMAELDRQTSDISLSSSSSGVMSTQTIDL